MRELKRTSITDKFGVRQMVVVPMLHSGVGLVQQELLVRNRRDMGIGKHHIQATVMALGGQLGFVRNGGSEVDAQNAESADNPFLEL